MIRKLLLGVGACSLLAGLCVGVGAGTASAGAPVTMSGTITCTVHGNFIFTTPLTNGGTTATNFRIFVGLTNCTGAGTRKGTVRVTGGTLQAHSTATVVNDCAPLTSGVPMSNMLGTIAWKTTGGTATGTNIAIAKPWIYYDYDYNLLTLGFPTSLTHGSYARQKTRFNTLYSNASGGQYTGQCGAGQTGLGTIFFGEPFGAPLGSVTIEAGV